MKDKILAFLKSKIPGGQESFLTGVANDLSETITEEKDIETAITAGVIKTITASQKFLQAETDRRLSEGIKTYETKHGLKDGKPIVPPTPPPPSPPADDMPEWGKKLMELNEKLVGKLTAIETEKKAGDLNAKLKTKLITDLKIDEKDLRDFNLLTGVQLNEETEIETVANEIKAKHDATMQSLKDRGVNIVPPKDGNAASGLIKDIKDWNREKPGETKK
jgi:hypothetical protein